MNQDNQEQVTDKAAIGISLLIALCVVGVFCAVSIAVIEHIDGVPLVQSTKHINLPNNKDYSEIVI
jgi:hypothetical protein